LWLFPPSGPASSGRFPPLIAALIVALSWRASFYVLGVASLLWAVTWMWYFRDDPRDHRASTPEQIS
jgi:sugar phosphate permease